METVRFIFLLLSLAVLASCSTIIELPMHAIESKASDQKSPVKILILPGDELQSQSYSTSQLGTTWIYPLGRVIPEIALKSLSDFFEVVEIEGKNSQGNYDYSISVKLLGFTAVVPSTIFSPTETSIELEYTLRKISTGETYTLSAKSGQNVITPRDQYIYDNLTKEVEDLFVYTSVVMFSGPKYEYLAARDGMMSIYKCTYDLGAALF